MRCLSHLLIVLGFCTGISVLVLTGCGGGPTGPGDAPAQDEPFVVPGAVALPAGSGINAASLQVVCGNAGTAPDANGVFELELPDGSGTLGFARLDRGGPLLMGWLGTDAVTLSSRSTAEALLYLGLGGWLLPSTAQPALRDRIAALGSELDPLETVVAAEILAHPEGLPAHSPSIQATLVATMNELLEREGDRFARGVLVEPFGEHSGVAVLNTGGLQSITLRNSYRRRVWVSVDRTAWVDDADREHEIDEPALTFEMPPVAGFAGVIGTIGDYFAGNVAYTPVEHGPVALRHWPDSKYTRYEVITGGMGVVPPDGDDALTQSQLDAIEYTALKTVVWDFFLPLAMNVVGTLGQLEVLGDVSGLDPDRLQEVTGLINYCATTVPAIVEHASDGNPIDAVGDLWNALAGNGDFQSVLFGVLRNLFESLGVEGGHAGMAVESAADFLQLVGWIDIVGGFMDSGIIVSHIGLSDVADRWDIKVTQPVVTLLPLEGWVPMGGRLDTLRVHVDDDTGEGNDGSAYAYHWRCEGGHGSLINPLSGLPDDEFQSSRDWVSYQADVNIEGVDSVSVDVYRTLGGQQEYIGSASSPIEVFWGVGVEEYLEIAGQGHFNLDLWSMVVPYWLYFTWERDPEALFYRLVVFEGTGLDVPTHLIETDGHLFGNADSPTAGHIVVQDSLVYSLEYWGEYGDWQEVRAEIYGICGDWWGLAQPVRPGR